MKVEVLKENLKSGLGIAERVVGKNLSLPILDNVLLDTEDSFLSLTTTDLETAIKLWILTKIVKKGKTVVPARFFSTLVSSLPNEKIILEAKGQNLRVECKNLENQIQGYNPEEFPIIPEIKNLEYIESDNRKFCQGISQIVDIASPSQTRPEISGVYFNFSKNTVKMAATDSFRLAEKTVTLQAAVKKDYSFILPQKPAREIINILEEKEGVLKIFFSPNQILFSFPMPDTDRPQVQITSRLIEGEYPPYQEIIPKKFKTKAVIKRDEFLNQIKTASLFSGKINEVKLTVKPDVKEIEIFAQSPDIGESRSNISAKIEGEAIEASFNHKFLIDGLNNIKSSEVSFELSKEDGASVLRPIGDASYIYVVMPIKAD